MAPQLNKSKPASLKTYSRRVNSNIDGPSSKRKLFEDSVEVQLPSELPKVKRQSIQDYFKPKQISLPNPQNSVSLSQNHLDALKSASLPSPPPRIIGASDMFDQRPKRRLLSRPNISKNTSLSILSSDIEYEDPSFSSGSERAIRHHSPKHRVPLKTTATNLHQVQLDLGVSAMKQCKACGMEYNSTVPEDRKLHDEYHKTKLKATQPIRTPLGQLSRNITIDGETYEIRVLDSRGPVQSRVHFEQALGTMYMDLPGDEIESADLWSQISNPIKSSVLQQVPRFTVLMLLSNRTPLAILVVERINKGGGYLDDFRSSQTDNDVSIGKSRKGYGKPDVIKLALMSIERIWVDKDFRRKGLATTLIDHARGILIPELKIQRSQVAFSWPTTLGRSLATRYSLGQHDEAIPFLVNFADCPDL